MFARAVPSSFATGSLPLQVERGDARIVCRKPDIHPAFFSEAKVFCKGEHVMTTGGTQAEYVVDIWSGNHPFYQGGKSGVVMTTDQLEKFRRKYGSLGSMNNIPVITNSVPKFDKKGKKPDKKKKR
ncbi:uncharacterized protein LOC9632984 [Selaginella moellendorffii]|nr:uncharacterized protein LOC9632984 [Selaginella moellendorffii]|eukprot:XP_002970712.2 uncharacterized protein LOC9632984 [Selaginella moellendorffii]